MGTFSDEAKEGAEKSSTTLQQRWIVRGILITLTFLSLLLGAVLLGVGASANVRNPIPGSEGLKTGGIILLLIFAASGITWLSMLCCCGYKWLCTRH